MFDDEEIYVTSDDDTDDFDYYVSFIRALEEEQVTKSDIVFELMDEFDLEEKEAINVLKRYLREKSEDDDDDDYEEDIVEDDDYGDGNSER